VRALFIAYNEQIMSENDCSIKCVSFTIKLSNGDFLEIVTKLFRISVSW
jgi:hypothetical protein